MHEVKHYTDSLGIEFDGFCLPETDAARCLRAKQREMDHALDYRQCVEAVGLR